MDLSAGSGACSDDGDEEILVMCSVCDRELPEFQFPRNPDGTVKGKRCFEDIKAWVVGSAEQ